MPKYNVYATVTGGKFVGTFEAASEDAARDLAMGSEEASVSLCHQCSSECEDPECTDFHVELEADQ